MRKQPKRNKDHRTGIPAGGFAASKMEASPQTVSSTAGSGSPNSRQALSHRSGETMRQGPYQLVQESSSTGRPLSVISFWKFSVAMVNTDSPIPPMYFVYSSVSALMGQNFTHFPQRVHFSRSTVGASKCTCDRAPTGQTLTEGQEWFCGHLLLFTIKAFPALLSAVALRPNPKAISFKPPFDLLLALYRSFCLRSVTLSRSFCSWPALF